MPDLDTEQLEQALRDLGDLLASRGQHYELVLIGGGNIMLRGLISRTTTRDLDLLGEWTEGTVQPLRPLPADFQDLQELQPSREELLSAARWTLSHDPSVGYRSLLVAVLERMGVEHANAALG